MVGPRSRFRRAVREVPLRRTPNAGPAIIAAGLARWIIHSLPPAPGMEPPDGIRRVTSTSWSRQEDADPGLDACQAKPSAKNKAPAAGEELRLELTPGRGQALAFLPPETLHEGGELRSNPEQKLLGFDE